MYFLFFIFCLVSFSFVFLFCFCFHFVLSYFDFTIFGLLCLFVGLFVGLLVCFVLLISVPFSMFFTSVSGSKQEPVPKIPSGTNGNLIPWIP